MNGRRVWIGFIWLRIWTSSGRGEPRNEPPNSSLTTKQITGHLVHRERFKSGNSRSSSQKA